MNDEEFGSRKFLKFKYREADQIIQPFRELVPPKKLYPPLFNLKQFQKIEKSTAESYRMH